MGCSIKKGQRVIVVGRLKMRSWERDGRIHHIADNQRRRRGPRPEVGLRQLHPLGHEDASPLVEQGRSALTASTVTGTAGNFDEPDDGDETSDDGDPAATA